MKKILILVYLLVSTLSYAQIEKIDADPYEWLHQGKYGLFVHWGIYSKLGGVYKNQKLHCEWIMRSGQIPIMEYRQIASTFNPVQFDAEEWVKLVKDAGMSFIMVTAKHHDGFAMYDSEVSDFNIMDATPFKRDPIKELQEACDKYGIKLCLYYSSGVDWESPYYDYKLANNWDFKDESRRNMDKYVYDKCLPQIRELLDNYGSIGAFFFDYGPVLGKYNHEIVKMINTVSPPPLTTRLRSFQGKTFDKLDSKADAEVPKKRLDTDWISPVMMNNNWGFDQYDNNWKSSQTIIHMLAQMVSKGGNMAINVGPTGLGEIQEEAQVRLREVGSWLEQNGEAIYGTTASPYIYGNERFAITRKDNKLYLITFDWPQEKLLLYGLKSKVNRISLLLDDTELSFTQSKADDSKTDLLTIQVPEYIPGWEYAPSPFASVVVLEFEDDDIEVDNQKMQEPDGTVHLYPEAAVIDKTGNPEMRVNGGGVDRWTSPGASFKWTVNVVQPARFKIILCTQQRRKIPWDGNHDISLFIGNKEFNKSPLVNDRIGMLPENYRKRIVETDMGEIEIAEPGPIEIKLVGNALEGDLRFWKVKLVPEGSGYSEI